MAGFSKDGFLNLRHMALACEAIRQGSVSAAASALNMTQPAASQGIAGIERQIGAPLFDRKPGGLQPTRAGEVFEARATRALALLRDGTKGAARLAPRAARARTDASRNFTAAQIRALIAVGTHGSFTVAAKDLAVSQPTVHRAAREIEAQCGFAIFRPSRGRVEITPAGEHLLRHARLARAEMRQCREEIDALAERGKSTFVLGSLPLARSEIVPRAIAATVAADPTLQIRVVEGQYAELLRALREGDLDCLIGALRDPAPATDVTEEPLFTDELAIVCAPGHPLTQAPSPTIADAADYPWIAPPITAPAGRFLAESLGLDGVRLSNVRVVTSSLVLIKAMLLRGDFLTIISRYQIDREVRAGELAVLPIKLEGNARAIGLTMRKSWYPTAPQERFTGALRQAASETATRIATSLTL